MELTKVIVLGCAATVFALLVKQQRPEIALLISIAAGAALLIVALNHIQTLAAWADGISRKFGLNMEYVGIAVKITGMACLCDWGASLCRDAGESAIASRIELCGRLLILVLAIPIVEELLTMVAALLK